MKTYQSALVRWGGSVLSVLGLLAACYGLPEISAKDKKVKPPKPAKAESEVVRFFNQSEAVHIKIEIASRDFESLKKAEWKFGPQDERKKVQVTVREGSDVYTNVSLQLKGAAGSFRPITDRPALTLNFDKFNDGQKFHGLQKLSLNNSVQDATYASEQFSRELFLKAGVPTPRATHAHVELNGKDLGLYVLVEGWDKQFLKHHFRNTKGTLYDGGFIHDITDQLSVNAGDETKDQADRKALVAAVKEQDLTKRQAAIEKVLDLDRFISFLALDVMLWDWDGYGMNKNNWRLYHDPETDKLVFMPHGLDQLFWKTEGTVLPQMNGLAARAVLEVPSYRLRYFEKMKQLRATLFQAETMTNRIREIASRARKVLAKTDPDDLKDYDKRVTNFCRSITERVRSLDRQLETFPEPAKFSPAGDLALGNWKSKVDFGKPTLAQLTDPSGKTVLEASAKQGSSIGSFRTSVWLERGKYKVRGKVKTESIVADPGDPRAGAGVRNKTARPEKYTSGSNDWKDIEYQFEVKDPLSEVQLLCEFRGMEGRALFDLASLKLQKVK